MTASVSQLVSLGLPLYKEALTEDEVKKIQRAFPHKDAAHLWEAEKSDLDKLVTYTPTPENFVPPPPPLDPVPPPAPTTSETQQRALLETHLNEATELSKQNAALEGTTFQWLERNRSLATVLLGGLAASVYGLMDNQEVAIALGILALGVALSII